MGYNHNARKRVSVMYQALKSQGILKSLKEGDLDQTLEISGDLKNLLVSEGLSDFIFTLWDALLKAGSGLDNSYEDSLKSLVDKDSDVRYRDRENYKEFLESFNELRFTADPVTEVSVDKVARAARRLKKQFPDLHVGASSAEKYGTTKDWVKVDGPLSELPPEFIDAAIAEGLQYCADPNADRLLLFMTKTGWSSETSLK